jgi:choline-sulfatase
MYDHSVRVPFMVVGPNVPAGVQIQTPIYLQDVMPTSLELAGDAVAEGVEFKSLLPLIDDESTPHYEQIFGAYMNRQRMVTYDGWKLIHYPTIQVDRLYDLTHDPQEVNDLAADPKHADRLVELRSRLASLMESMNDPITMAAAN